ncbi:hypothetical protein [Okeania sp. KiyG1]|uniref:hypothetical protein n=1 Tax=Okeania sp. KiyG1 TaxID=2720165 RepID=UPI001924CDB9|nr:hypothetical protein [Okeania sp. KiyG1]GFZ93612.1 hypothetical protein CYANOKiyG1_04400 [Okeania sp. KiyG1]
MITSTEISGKHFEGRAYLIVNSYDVFYFESCLGFDDKLDLNWNASSPVYHYGIVFINNAFYWELLEVFVSEFTLIELIIKAKQILKILGALEYIDFVKYMRYKYHLLRCPNENLPSNYLNRSGYYKSKNLSY